MMRTCRPWPLLLLFLFVSCSSNLSEARLHHHNLPSAVVVGSVYCDTCFQHDFSRGSHYISGATVAVECDQGSSRPAFYQEVKTDKQGAFKVGLPFYFWVSQKVGEIEGCNVKLVASSEPYCAVASTASSTGIHLKEKERGTHIFSAGFFTFKPLKQPELCNKQPSVTNSKLKSLQPSVTPDPTLATLNPLLPTVPNLPLMPPLPNLPPLLPPLPIAASHQKRVANGRVSPQQFFPPVFGPPSGFLPPTPLTPAPLIPIPLQPPAAPLVPFPFLPPPPPPTLLPPVPQLPPLPTLPPVPTIPGLTQPTPSLPPPTPSLPIPPVIPLPPFPLIPGIPIPPASSNSNKLNP